MALIITFSVALNYHGQASKARPGFKPLQQLPPSCARGRADALTEALMPPSPAAPSHLLCSSKPPSVISTRLTLTGKFVFPDLNIYLVLFGAAHPTLSKEDSTDR